MTIGEIRKMDIPDDTEVKINTIWDEARQELLPTECDGFYHKVS